MTEPSSGRASGGQLHGKQPLVLLAVVAAVLVGGLALWSAHRNAANAPVATAVPGASNVNGGTTATPDQIQRLKSWGLVASELPSGTDLRTGEEFRNYAAARGNKQAEQELADKGRVDGFFQAWINDSAHVQVLANFDLYDSPANAMATLAQPVTSDATYEIKELPDPKLGSFSRMYGFTTVQANPKSQGWVVQWVRGRTVLEVNGVAPPGELASDAVLADARAIDARAAKSPIN